MKKNIKETYWVAYHKSYELPAFTHFVKEKYDLHTFEAVDDKLCYFVFDFSTLTNVYVSDNFEKITGYPKEEGLRGFEFIQQHIHPEDAEKCMYYSIKSHELLMKVPLEKRINARLRMNYRFLHSTKGYVSILHQATFSEFTEKGIPLVSCGYMLDLTGFLPSSQQTGLLEFNDGETAMLEENSKVIRFTKREKDIIILAKRGNASKNIADQLGLSINTVHNIRATLLKKSKAKNIAELIAIATNRGIV